MRWLRDTRVLSVVLVLLVLIGYFVVYEVVFPLLWPHREHPLVWILLAFVMGLGFNFSKATAYAKVMNVASNVAALTLFLGCGSVWLAAGLVMAVGQMVGSVLGAHLVMQKGAGFVRPLYLTVVIALLLNLLYERVTGTG